jgi:amino acid adenylation domain-containing protein
VPKLFLGGDDVTRRFVVVGSAEAEAEGEAASTPGKLIAATVDAMHVSTGRGSVRLGNFSTLSGDPLSGLDVLEYLSPNRSGVPFHFPVESPQMLAPQMLEVSEMERAVAVTEDFWVLRLRSISPYVLPLDTSSTKEADTQVGTARLSGLGHASISGSSEKLCERAVLISVVGAFFARLADLDSDEQAWRDFGFVVPSVGVDAAFANTELANTELANTELASLFSASVPFRISTSLDCSFASFCERVRDELNQIESGRTYAIDVFSRYPTLRGSGQPRYGVSFCLCGSKTCQDVAPQPRRTTALDEVTVHVDDAGVVTLVHSGLSDWQVEQIVRGISALAIAAFANPEISVSCLPLVDSDTVEKMNEWNQTAAPFPDKTVHQLFEEMAQQTPDAPAVRFGGNSISYQQIDESASLLAQQLRSAGVGPGSVVAISFTRNESIVVAMLGVLKTGAAYLPIDPTYPHDRVRNILIDAKVDLAISCASISARLINVAPSLRCVVLDREFQRVVGRIPERVAESGLDLTRSVADQARMTPDDLVYVIYTSGSSGTPKGVEIRHRGLVNHSTAIARNYGLGRNSRLLFSASMSFDVAAEQIFPALLSGAEVVVAPENLFDSFSGFTTFVQQEQITALVLPTAFWHEWVREIERTGSVSIPSVVSLSVGTEKALGSVLESWQHHTKNSVKFFQGYGPTETTITCTMLIHDGAPVDRERPLSIGRPLPNTSAHIVDRNLRALPLGVSGELLIGGVGLARGYRNNPTLTADRFVCTPTVINDVVYRTGDLARFEGTGEIVFLGRRDFQVKIRGYRVELGEVEQALGAHESVSEAVVVLREDFGLPELIGYVVAAAETSTEQILGKLSAQLPEYMVPRALVRMEQFPKTTNQKVDRRALPKPMRASSQHVIEARNATEATLIDLWRVQLGTSTAFGVTDEFFTLGGDSLRCLAMLAGAEREFGRSISLSSFVANPTIEYLSKLLLADEPVASPVVVPINRGSSKYPLWLVHPVGGHVVYAEHIRRNMDTNQTIFGLQARGLDGLSGPLETIESMAELYVEHMCTEQPTGPYFIAGPSMGGLIALEIAQRLLQKGHEIGVLVLIDTFAPGYPRPTSQLTKFLDQVRSVKTQNGLRNRVEFVRTRRARTNPLLADAGGRVGVSDAADDIRGFINTVTHLNMVATDRYVPRRYPGRIHLIRAEIPMRWSGMRFDDPLNGWGPLAADGVTAVTLSLSHYDLVDRPPAEVGLALQALLQKGLSDNPNSL